MEHGDKINFVDDSGQPLTARIQRVLQDLVPRFRRQFPTLRDDVFMTDVLEAAGRRIVDRETRSDPVKKLYSYAWAIVRRIAVDRLEHPSMRVARKTLGPEASRAALLAMRSALGTPEEIEREIFLHEVLSQLTTESENCACTRRAALAAPRSRNNLGVRGDN